MLILLPGAFLPNIPDGIIVGKPLMVIDEVSAAFKVVSMKHLLVICFLNLSIFTILRDDLKPGFYNMGNYDIFC
jgi:hypothetical protein